MIKEFADKFRIADSALLRSGSVSSMDASSQRNINDNHTKEQHGVGISFELHHLLEKVSNFSASSKDGIAAFRFEYDVAYVFFH